LRPLKTHVKPREQDIYKVSVIDLPQARRLAFGVVLGQAAVTLVAALCALGIGGRIAFISALAGGAIATLGSLAMAGVVFGVNGAAGAQRALGAFYAGEIVKVGIVIALFVVVLKAMTVAPLALFAAFVATFVVYWIGLLRALSGARARASAERT
jgi:ATP synthase protein I